MEVTDTALWVNQRLLGFSEKVYKIQQVMSKYKLTIDCLLTAPGDHAAGTHLECFSQKATTRLASPWNIFCFCRGVVSPLDPARAS